MCHCDLILQRAGADKDHREVYITDETQSKSKFTFYKTNIQGLKNHQYYVLLYPTKNINIKDYKEHINLTLSTLINLVWQGKTTLPASPH